MMIIFLFIGLSYIKLINIYIYKKLERVMHLPFYKSVYDALEKTPTFPLIII